MPFGGWFRKMTEKVSKSIRFFTKSWWRFTTSQNSEIPMEFARFSTCRKSHKIPYKTCRFRSLFWSLTQKGSQNPYKTCWILTKISGFAKNEKRKIPVALRSFWSTRFFCKKPYKTCRLWRLFWSFAQNGLKKYQKSIRFFTKNESRCLQKRKIKHRKPL